MVVELNRSRQQEAVLPCLGLLLVQVDFGLLAGFDDNSVSLDCDDLDWCVLVNHVSIGDDVSALAVDKRHPAGPEDGQCCSCFSDEFMQ